MRISKISACANIRLLEQTDLVTETLAGCIETMLEGQRFTSSIMLDGTARTAAIIERHLNP